jgi:hypothetical protein
MTNLQPLPLLPSSHPPSIFLNPPSLNPGTQLNFGTPSGWRDGTGALRFDPPGTGSNYSWRDGNGAVRFGPPSGSWISGR